MNLLIFTLLACCVIVLPVIAHRHRWQPASLFLTCAFVWAVFGAIAALFLATTIPMASPADLNGDQHYYTVSRFHTYLNTALFLTLPAALLWAQQKLAPQRFLRLSHWLFWAINLGLLANSFAQSLIVYFIRPRRYADYEGAFRSVAMMSGWITQIVQLSMLVVVLLFAASLILRLARHFRPS